MSVDAINLDEAQNRSINGFLGNSVL